MEQACVGGCFARLNQAKNNESLVTVIMPLSHCTRVCEDWGGVLASQGLDLSTEVCRGSGGGGGGGVTPPFILL